MEGKKMKRSKMLSVCMDEKLHYLVTLAARDQDKTLSSLLEYVIRKSLISGSFDQYGYDGVFMGDPLTPAVSHFEGYWDEDPADRLYLRATGAPRLLTEAEAGFWQLSSGSLLKSGEKLTLANYRKWYHHPAYNTAHLAETEGAK